jgi:hypothetical protein
MIPDSLFRCDICDLTHGRHCEPWTEADIYADVARRAQAERDEAERPDILEQARALVRGDRNESYGSGVREMQRVGQAWGALLDRGPIDGRTVALMMVALKGIRATCRVDSDDEIDAAGYILLAADCRENE